MLKRPLRAWTLTTMPTSRSPLPHFSQISEALALHTLRGRQWSIQETSATKGKGLFEGFDWLVNVISGGKAT